jgi:hypothetical protein
MKQGELSLKNYIGNAILFIVTLFLMLLFSEFAIKYIFPQQLVSFPNDKVWQSDSTLGWKHVINANTVINTGEQSVKFITDNKGFRVNCNSGNRSLNKILVVGDSFVEAIQVENDDTMNEKLIKKLVLDTKIQYDAINTGVAGWSPNQYYLQAKDELKKNKYRLGIVYIFAGNDFLDDFDTILRPRNTNEKPKFKIPLGFNKVEWINNFFYPINNYLETRSHFFILFRKSFKVMLAKLGLTPYYFPDIFSRSVNTENKKDAFYYAVNSIVELFESYHTPLVFVLIPESYQVNKKIFNQYVSMFNISQLETDLFQPNRIAFQTVSSMQGILLDPLDFLTEKHQQGEILYFPTDGHLNETGHEAICDFIYPTVKTLLERSD